MAFVDRSVSLVIACLFMLLAVGLPAGHAAPTSEGALVITDPAGDVSADAPVTADRFGHVDITRLEVGGDDAQTLRFAIAFDGPSGPLGPAARTAGVDGVRCAIGWSYNAKSDLFTFETQFSRPAEGSTTTASMRYHWTPPDGHGLGYGWSVRDAVGFEADNESIVVLLPKEHVAVGDTGQPPGPGDRITDLSASCRTDGASDKVEAEGRHYALQDGQVSGPVALRLGPEQEEDEQVWRPPPFGGYGSRLAVVIGEMTNIPLTLTNSAGSKKIVTLNVSVTDYRDEPVEGWTLQMPDHVTVPADAARTIDLRIVAPSDVRLGSRYGLAVEATLLAEEGTSSVTEMVTVTTPMDEDRNRLWFHTTTSPDAEPPSSTLIETGLSGSLRLSSVKDDPRYDDGVKGVFPGGGAYHVYGTLPVPSDLRFDIEGQTTGRLAVTSDTGAPVRVAVDVATTAQGSGTIARFTGEGSGVIELEGSLVGDEPFVPAGGSFRVTTEVEDPTWNGEPAGRMLIDPTESWLQFPILPAVEESEAGNGTWRPSLRLAQDEDASSYVNPGGRYDFGLVVGNDGMETDDIEITLAVDDATDWDVAVLPGAAFRVPSGEAAWVGVSVQAPADAAEGDRLDIRATATSRNDPAALARLDLSAVVTTTVAFDDKVYEARDDQAAPLTDEDEESPAVGLLGLSLCLGMLALLRGRRRR